jgi:hypothetical protein
MSSPIANVEVVATKVARVKKPSLPAKYSKFVSFGFWFLNKMDATVRDQLFPEIKLFSSIEEQSAFFQSYLDEASASNKIMRKTVAAFHKPPKVRAEKKSRKSSKPVAAESDDLIAKLIADANGSTEPASGDAPVQEKPKKSRKSTKKTEEPVALAAEAPTEPVAQDDDSDEIQTRIVTIDGGKQYLIDSEYNLYDITSHEQIGKFDPETNQPILA